VIWVSLNDKRGGETRMKIEADLVIVNAHIITMDPEAPRAQALAVKNYKVIAVGSDDEILDLVPNAKRVMDLGGQTLIPGFVDAHTHLTSTGIDSFQADLTTTNSATDVITTLRGHMETNKPKGWIVGHGWDESKWKTKKYLTAKDLDRVSAQQPVAAIRIDGHLLVVNTVGLSRMRLDMQQEGVEHGSDGKPTGVFKDVDKMYDSIPVKPEEIRAGVIAGTSIAASLGITTAIDNVSAGYLRSIRDVERNDDLRTRIVVNIPEVQFKHLLALGITTGMGTPLTRIGGLKLFSDGSIGAATAAVSKPYKGSKDNLGMLLIEKTKMRKILKKATAGGIQTLTHAIGNRAIEMVLQSFESLSQEEKELVREQRHRIEHAEMITEDQIRRAASLGLILSMQPNFVDKWQLEGGLYDQRFDKKRVANMNNFRIALDNGARVCFGSDGMPLGPLYGIYAATTHPNPRVRLTVEEALTCYTRESAYASFLENTVGSIREGQRADFVVLSTDILTTPPQRIKDIEVKMTLMGGEVVYSSENF
jgi:predicted amidohydrolase YtcJ